VATRPGCDDLTAPLALVGVVFVLDGARLVESGTHEALMARGGQYADLYGIQAAAYR